MNNPARRLYIILSGLKSQPELHVDEAFAKVLNVEPANYSLLMKRIGLVFMLIDATQSVVKSIKGINHDKYLLAVSDISAKMRGVNFAQKVRGTTIGEITSSTMAYLDMTAEYLSKHSPEPTITEENRKKILASIFDFWKEVEETSGIPEKLRQFIFDKLDLLRQAVEVYDITGANPMKEAAESIVGGMFFKSLEYKEHKQSIPILNKLFKCAVSAYCTIEVLNNIAVLPESIKTIAGFLGVGN